MPESDLILYADDERGNRVVFEHSFSKDFNVRTVESGPAALEVLQNERVAVVVSDQRMPEMSGNELLQQVKALYPDTVRIVITAYGDLDPILDAVNEGLVARYIVKPWKRDELRQILHWAVETYNAGQQDSAIQLRLLETERLTTLGSMAAAVLHDVNGSMSYLFGNVGVLEEHAKFADVLQDLLKRHDNELPFESKKPLTMHATELPAIVEEMRAGCELILELCASVSKLVNPQEMSDQAMRNVDPLPVVHYVLRACKRTVEHAGGRLRYDGPQELPSAAITWAQLAQTLLNLVLNAAQALERVDRHDGRVVILAADTSDFISIIVRDNGPGMSEEVLQNAETLFYTTREGGTGLGLAQCRRTIESAGGRLEIESKEGNGTTVTVTLPKVG